MHPVLQAIGTAMALFRWAAAAALLSTATLLVASPALAHHSFAAFEDARVRTLEGTIKAFQWTNPHVLLEILVKPLAAGEPQEWKIESSSPAILRRFGWTANSLKPGDHVGIICNPLRDGSPGGRLHTLTLPETGRKLETKLSGSENP